MAFTENEKQKVLAAIQLKVPQIKNCPLCGNSKWSLSDGVVTLSIQDQPGTVVIGGPGLPCVTLVCLNCGNTVLLNMIVLELKDILEKKPGS
ncbi:MAG: hypothetical protein Q7J73_09105 [Dehalococcoidales bacterium]|nr:hypothetical protein [Dehalococcoidales bacterium]